MSDTPIETIREAIKDFLKGADLSSASSKKVRAHLNDKFDCDFNDRKKEIDKIVMEVLTELEGDENKDESEDPSEESEVSEEENSEEDAKAKKKAAGRKAPARKAPAKKPKKKKNSDSDDESEDNDDDYSEDDRKKKKKQQKKPRASNGAAKKAGGAGKTTGYLKRLRLSPELAEVMGEPQMARNEVVKKMYAVVKERDLLDPKNRQFALLDDQLQKVFGAKRVRMFGMLKLLGKHFLAD